MKAQPTPQVSQKSIDKICSSKNLSPITSNSDSPQSAPSGMPNLGNTCYLNSAIQLLSKLSATQEIFDGAYIRQIAALLPPTK